MAIARTGTPVTEQVKPFEGWAATRPTPHADLRDNGNLRLRLTPGTMPQPNGGGYAIRETYATDGEHHRLDDAR
ncbi:MAG: hypothetical protein EOM24_10590 [Chloroflexia bacterium]|nr:hypothetical protein [Chloroflexia bacterium]